MPRENSLVSFIKLGLTMSPFVNYLTCSLFPLIGSGAGNRILCLGQVKREFIGLIAFVLTQTNVIVSFLAH